MTTTRDQTAIYIHDLWTWSPRELRSPKLDAQSLPEVKHQGPEVVKLTVGWQCSQWLAAAWLELTRKVSTSAQLVSCYWLSAVSVSSELNGILHYFGAVLVWSVKGLFRAPKTGQDWKGQVVKVIWQRLHRMTLCTWHAAYTALAAADLSRVTDGQTDRLTDRQREHR